MERFFLWFMLIEASAGAVFFPGLALYHWFIDEPNGSEWALVFSGITLAFIAIYLRRLMWPSHVQEDK